MTMKNQLQTLAMWVCAGMACLQASQVSAQSLASADPLSSSHQATPMPSRSSGTPAGMTNGPQGVPSNPMRQGEQTQLLTDVLDELQNRYDVLFNYEPDMVEGKRIDNSLIKLSSDAEVEDMLKHYLAPLKLSYKRLRDNYFIIYRRHEQKMKKLPRQPLRSGQPSSTHIPGAASFVSLQTLSFDETITGTVTDLGTDEPLPGVNVLVRGTTEGTVTDINGEYALQAPEDGVLVFSFVGYVTKEVPINGRSSIDVSMDQDASELDEVVVVGYGTQRRSEITESIAQISTEEIDQERVARVDQALQGRVSGVNIKQQSGSPGSGLKVRIRGSRSIQGDNDPLYVVDGLIVSNISNIDVNNISSIEVLKDASATAIYGSRGANGVILITTKEGTDEGRFALNSSYGIQSIRHKLDLMNGAEFARTVNAEREANGVGAAFSEEQIANLEATGGTDWQEEIFRTAPIQNHRLSYSGGSDQVKYYLSAGYLQQEGIVIAQNYKRYNFRSNVDYQYSERFDIGLNFQATREERDGASADVAAGIPFNPAVSVRDPQGQYNLRTPLGSNTLNQVAAANEMQLENFDHTLISNLNLDYKISDALTLQVIVGAEYFTFDHNEYTPRLLDDQGTAITSNLNRLRLQNTNRLTYQQQLGDDHRLKADLIFEQQSIQATQDNITARNFPTDAAGYKDLGIAESPSLSSLYRSEKLRSYVGRVNYSFDERYLITGTVRVDGSSKFREENRYGVFPSVSVGWRLTNEEFIQNLELFSELKLRASYGITGSQAIDAYSTRAPLVTGIDPGYPITGTGLATGIGASGQLANPDLTWEETTQQNIGLDMTFNSGRISITADVYSATTRDLLLDVLLPNYTGVNVVTRNIGVIENRGIELVLKTQPISTNNFNLTADFNISANRNEVVDLGEERNRIYPDNIFQGSFSSQTETSVVQEGEPLGAFQGYDFLGIYQSDEAQEAAEYNKNPGDSKYRDFNNDGQIDNADFGIIGNAQPDFYFGLNTTLNYKNFDVSVLFQGSYGGEIYNVYKGALYGWGAGTTRNPIHRDVLNRWTPDNPSNAVAAFGPTRHGFILSDQFLEDGSYARIKNLSLGYTLPERLINTLGLGTLRIYANAENLLTITKYTGFDPELSSGGTSDTDESVDYAPYPTAKTFILGLNVTF